ncbi:hypothetical protein SAMN05444413_11674 [Roseivivax marinus]|nr:hypothetical protein SAMN05444413_11674 [Roseivivax marinus]
MRPIWPLLLILSCAALPASAQAQCPDTHYPCGDDSCCSR